jgi:hypothetical protein
MLQPVLGSWSIGNDVGNQMKGKRKRKKKRKKGQVITAFVRKSDCCITVVYEIKVGLLLWDSPCDFWSRRMMFEPMGGNPMQMQSRAVELPVKKEKKNWKEGRFVQRPYGNFARDGEKKKGREVGEVGLKQLKGREKQEGEAWQGSRCCG